MEPDENQDDLFSPEMMAMVQPGKVVRVFFPPPNVNNELRHIRAIVDLEYVVYRVWSKHRQMWFYRVGNLLAFQLLWQDGYLKPA